MNQLFVRLMKSLELILMTATLTVLAVALTIQSQQNVAAFNEKNNNFVSNSHNHLRIGDFEGGPEEIQSSSGSVYNDEDRHSSSNYNSERGENGNGYERNNDHAKPNGNGNGNGHNGDETEP
jgi:hypothetical protein